MITALAVLVALGAGGAGEEKPTPAPTPSLSILLAKPEEGRPVRASSLADVAKRIKLNLPANQPRVINNDTVKQLAQGVELTMSAAAPPLTGAVRGGTAEERKKAIWQERYRAAQDRVRRLEGDIKELSSRANQLEQEFYAHDDPVYRDSTIKPAWDRALADLAKAKTDLADARGEPDRVLNAARRDGALPGWFRGLDEGTPTASRGEGAAARPGPTGRPPATPTPRSLVPLPPPN